MSCMGARGAPARGRPLRQARGARRAIMLHVSEARLLEALAMQVQTPGLFGNLG